MDLGSAEVERRRFDVKRKGYDPAEVTVYLHRVAGTMADLEAAAKEAEVRVGRLQRDLLDLLEVSENGFHQLVASKALDHPQQIEAVSMEIRDAERIVAAATDHATRLRRQAESALEDALATTAMIEVDQARLLTDAKAGRDALLAEASLEADEIFAAAKEVAATTRADAQRFAEELRELTAAETIELVTYAKAMAAAILEAAGGADISLSVDDDDLTVDLREPAPDPEPTDEETSGLGGTRPSRYEARSAHLPSIGDESESGKSLRERLGEA